MYKDPDRQKRNGTSSISDYGESVWDDAELINNPKNSLEIPVGIDVDLVEYLDDVGDEYILVTPDSKENIRDVRLGTRVQYVVERRT